MEKKDLKPAGVFKYFEEICQVPRPSKKEGVGEEVVLNVVVLFTHHVDMRLQYDSLQVFFSRSSGFLDKYVTGFVHFGFPVRWNACLP